MKSKKGFTLIELIAVVAILAILAAVAVPRVIHYVENSKKVAIKTNCKMIYDATQAEYNDGKLGELIDPLKKELSDRDNGGKYSDWEALCYLNSEKLMKKLVGDKVIKPDNDMNNLVNRLNSFGRIEAVVEAPIDIIKVDSSGLITEESADKIYENWQENK